MLKLATAALVTSLAWLTACAPSAMPAEGTTTGSPSTAPAASAAPARPAERYLVLAPRAFKEELEPLAAHRRAQGLHVTVLAAEDVYAARSAGAPSAEALSAEIVERSRDTASGPLKYVLLAGDPAFGPVALPSLFDKIGDWIPSGFERRPHRTDHGFAQFDGPALAVGRLPSRTEAEMTAVVSKLIAYEGGQGAGAWQRRVLVFGGPADFGPIADGALEAQATSLLDELLPYDFDLGVIFAKADSPYVYRYDRLGAKIVEELNEGALLAVYAGHGLEDSFDRARYRGQRYPIGSVAEVETLDIKRGPPIFVSLTCLTGDYGRPGGARSIAETMIMDPGGPVAVFASSDVSHPYPNLLYAQALLDAFILKRTPTVGEAVFAAKRDMLKRSIPFASLLVPGDHAAIKREHLTLYNLLGDPATRVQLPLAAKVEVDKKVAKPGERVTVSVASEELTEASLVVTLETERIALKPGMVSSPALEAMPVEQAFEAMAKNYEIASDKILATTKATLTGGAASVQLDVPKAPGRYVVKVLLQGAKAVASGHVRVDVAL